MDLAQKSFRISTCAFASTHLNDHIIRKILCWKVSYCKAHKIDLRILINMINYKYKLFCMILCPHYFHMCQNVCYRCSQGSLQSKKTHRRKNATCCPGIRPRMVCQVARGSKSLTACLSNMGSVITSGAPGKYSCLSQRGDIADGKKCGFFQATLIVSITNCVGKVAG